MKHFSKKHCIFFLLALLLVSALTGCSNDPKNFTVGDLTVTLTKAFKESRMNEFDVYITSDTVSFTAKRETLDSLEHAGYEINSLNDYAMEILESNKLDKSALKQRNSYMYFKSEGTKAGAKYTYVHCLFKGSSAYWICEFVCKSSNYSKLEDSILGWADTISIN